MGNAVPVSTQEYKWIPANCQGILMKCWGDLAMDYHPMGGGGRVVILVVASWHRNRDELQLDGSLGSSVVPFIYK